MTGSRGARRRECPDRQDVARARPSNRQSPARRPTSRRRAARSGSLKNPAEDCGGRDPTGRRESGDSADIDQPDFAKQPGQFSPDQRIDSVHRGVCLQQFDETRPRTRRRIAHVADIVGLMERNPASGRTSAAASATNCSGWGTLTRTRREVATSKDARGSPVDRASPSSTSTFPRWRCEMSWRARATASALRSTPTTRPVGPTRSESRSRQPWGPQPISTTRAPRLRDI
jgi:hypothetical protein